MMIVLIPLKGWDGSIGDGCCLKGWDGSIGDGSQGVMIVLIPSLKGGYCWTRLKTLRLSPRVLNTKKVNLW